MTPRSLNSLAMCKKVLLTSRGDVGKVGVGKTTLPCVEEQRVLIDPHTDRINVLHVAQV